MNIYENKDRKCECNKCEVSNICNYIQKYQRMGREYAGALGSCWKLEENKNEYDKFLKRHNAETNSNEIIENNHYLETNSNEIIVSEHYTKAVEIHRSIITNAQLAQSAIFEMGKGLQTMRDDKLYKELGYNNFEDYCQKEFQLGKAQAYKYISIVENLSDDFVYSSGRFGVTKLYLLSTLSEEKQLEITDIDNIDEISVKQLKERIRELEGTVDREKQDRTKAESEVSALNNVNGKLTEKSRTLENKVQELENKPAEVAVQEKEVIVPNEEYEAKIKTLQEEYSQKLEQLKRDNKALTEQVQNVPESQTPAESPDKVKFKVLLTSTFDAVKRAADFVQSTAQPEQEVFRKQLERIKELI